MTSIHSVAAHIREAKVANPELHVSDFQIRVEASRTALVNLKTGDVRIVPAARERFAEFCGQAEAQDSAGLIDFLS